MADGPVGGPLDGPAGGLNGLLIWGCIGVPVVSRAVGNYSSSPPALTKPEPRLG